MKFLLIIALICSVSNVFAAKKSVKPVSKIASIDTCFKTEDSLEREYCQKKRMKAIDEEFQASMTKYQAGYTQIEKDAARLALSKEIQNNKDLLKLVADELKMKEENIAKLESLLSTEEKEKAEKEKESNKQKEDVEKVKNALKKIFK